MNSYRPAFGQIVLHGAVAGLIAGVVLALSETAIAVSVLNLSWDAPLRWVAAIGVGTKALNSSYALENLVLPATLIHFALSALYGILFLWILSAARQLAARTPGVLLSGVLFGLFLWVLNFLLIVPNSFYFWFADLNQFWVGFLPHALFYGLVLGAYVAVVRPGAAEEVAA